MKKQHVFFIFILAGLLLCCTAASAQTCYVSVTVASCSGEISNTVVNLVDTDCDGFSDSGLECDKGWVSLPDNCPETPNGPDGGTCIQGVLGTRCTADADCGPNGFCSMDQEDHDADGTADVCESGDMDDDGVPDLSDNCPFLPNTDQGDTDGDGAGDPCDSDNDDDGVPDASDNCPFAVNPAQEDTDADGTGDACDLYVGTTYWAKTYGGLYDDSGYSICQTAEGGYAVAGYTRSFGTGYVHGLIVKLDENGAVQWQKTLGGALWDYARAVQQTSDGGFVVAGRSHSFGADSYETWVVKLDENGSVQWQKTYGGAFTELTYSIQQTADGGFALAGYTTSFGAATHTDSPEYLILKLDRNGTVQWQKTISGSDDDYATSMRQTAEGGFVVAGHTDSFAVGAADVFIVRLDESGSVQWQKTFGGTDIDKAYAVRQTADGGFAVAGHTQSFGAGNADSWIIKLDENGSVQWQKAIGGPGFDYAYCLVETADGGVAVAGHTQSFGAGFYDVWVVRLGENGSVLWQKTFGGTTTDYAYCLVETADGGFAVAGRTESFGEGDYDFWVLKLDANGAIPGCDLGMPSSAVITDTAVNGVDRNADVSDILVYLSYTSALPVDSDAEVAEQCMYTLVELSSFTAARAKGSVTLRWTTEAEIDNAGFNILRAECAGCRYERINDTLVPACGTASGGASYEFIDADVRSSKAYYYKLEDIDLNGVSTMHGSVEAVPRLMHVIGK